MMVSTAAAWSNNLDGIQVLVDRFIAIKFQQQGDLKQSNNKKKEQQIAKGFDVNAASRLLVLLALNAVTTARGEAYDKVFNHLDMLHAPLEGKVLILTTAMSLLLLIELKFYCLEFIYLIMRHGGGRLLGIVDLMIQKNLLKRIRNETKGSKSTIWNSTKDEGF
ncbi:hypothetical protein Tco_1401223 [Tanacetum coccineum]